MKKRELHKYKNKPIILKYKKNGYYYELSGKIEQFKNGKVIFRHTGAHNFITVGFNEITDINKINLKHAAEHKLR